MPRTATPSRACLACRARHYKCDEHRPACSACTRNRLECAYLAETDILFKVQTQSVLRRVANDQRARSSRRKAVFTAFKPSSPSCGAASPRCTLVEDPCSVAVSIFLARYCSLSWDREVEPGSLSLFPVFHRSTNATSSFQLALSASALAIVGRWPERLDWKRLSLLKYVEAVAGVNAALGTPQQYSKDEVLIAIHLLYIYEKINLPDVVGSAIGHIKGVIDLLALRGIQSFVSPQSKRLLLVLWNHILTAYLSPLDIVLPKIHDELWSDPPGGLPRNFTTDLVYIVSDIVKLRKLVHRCDADRDGHRVLDLQIRSMVHEINEKLLVWSSTVPHKWKALPAQIIPGSVYAAGLYDNLCEVYPSIWSANVWNRYRIARIALNTILIQHIARLRNLDRDSDLVQAAKIAIRAEANSVCACLPFYLGSRDTEKTIDQPIIDFPTYEVFFVNEETRESLIMFGEWYTFWPMSRMLHNLTVLEQIGQHCVPQTQMTWMKRQMNESFISLAQSDER